LPFFETISNIERYARARLVVNIHLKSTKTYSNAPISPHRLGKRLGHEIDSSGQQYPNWGKLGKALSTRSGKFLCLEDHRRALESQVVVHNVIDIRAWQLPEDPLLPVIEEFKIRIARQKSLKDQS
jgi:hypothetical protein